MTYMRASAGFTIVETLIVIVIVALIGAAMLELFISYDTVLSNQSAAVEADTSAAAIVNAVRDAALQASAIVSSHTFSGTLVTTGSAAIVVRLPAVDSAGNIVVNTYDYYGFYASGTDAYLAVDADETSERTDVSKRLSAVLSSMTFTYPSGDATQATSTTVDVVTSAGTGQSTQTRHLIEQVYLRNI